ncbi:protein ENTREP3 [Eudromia elegans]
MPPTAGALSRRGHRGRRRRRLLLALGFAQAALGVLVVTFSLVAAAATPAATIRRSCPSWAGFSLALSGLVGIVSCKRPLPLVVAVFALLSALGVALSLAGAVLSCRSARLVASLQACERERDACVCCWARPAAASCGAQSETLTLFAQPDCHGLRAALKDLLFSVCGLTVCSSVACALSAAVCCLHVFAPRGAHGLLPPRAGPAETAWPRGAPLPAVEPDEFVPPVPPPPYYPPEYTCSDETDAQSITYDGSMDSPGLLYPSDFPPSYETVMGLRGDSQATLFELQPAAPWRAAAPRGSGSLGPGDSSPSEDSCLLEPPGALDYVLFRSIQRSRADYCLSVDCVRCSHHARSPPLAARGPFEETPAARARGERSQSCSTAEPGGDGRPAAPPAPGAHSCNRLEGLARAAGPCFPEVRLKVPRGRPGARPRRSSDSSCPSSPGWRPLARWHSDPGALAPRDTDFREVLYTKALEDAVSDSSTDTGPCSESGQLWRPPRLLRAGSAGKSKEAPGRKAAPPLLSKAAARSLGDLKGCRGTRGLVARFLQRPKRPEAPAHKQVRRSGLPAAEGIHLPSCGDLSSPSSLRRLLSARRLERGRPRSPGAKESAP